MENSKHVGHALMELLKKDPDSIAQIDGATGDKETKSSLLSRSITLAKCLRKIGLKPGDVLGYGGRLHLDVHVPFYAGLMNGLAILGVDPSFKCKELKALFELAKPKIVFCQQSNYEDHVRALTELQLDCRLVTFDDGPHSLAKLIEENKDDDPNELFTVATFDVDRVYCWLVPTSGTTGTPKVAAISYSVVTAALERIHLVAEKTCENSYLNITPPNWISGYYNAISPFILNQIKLQSSRSDDVDHMIDVINKYKPRVFLCSPAFVAQMLKSEKHCDMTCFDYIAVAGAKVAESLMRKLMAKCKPGVVRAAYGLTETIGPILNSSGTGPVNSIGKPLAYGIVKLVDPECGTEVLEPNVPGELWWKGPTFSEYLNDPAETARAFSEDGFFMTGDFCYRDENGYLFFAGRRKLMIKHKNTQILPSEIEDVVMEHPGVEQVAVTSVPDEEVGEKPVAVVVRRPGSHVTAGEIRNIVANKLSKNKQLSGGVVFVEHLPLTSAGKLSKQKLDEVVSREEREF